MLNNMFLNVVYVAGMLLITALTLCALKLAATYLFHRKQSSAGSVSPGQTPTPVNYEVESISEHPVAIICDEKKPQEEVKTLEPEDVGEASDYPSEPFDALQCGACGKDITSDPVQMKIQPDSGLEMLIYQCEHCHQRVSVSVGTTFNDCVNLGDKL